MGFFNADEIYYFNEENPDDKYDTATYRVFETQNLPILDENGNESATKMPFPKHTGVQYYDYSKDAVTDMLSNYLSPKITALLKEAE